MYPLLVIVTGLPCTGKSTLAARMAREFSLPLVSKDGIKELLFDTLGWRDREWSRQLGLATYRILYHLVERQLAAGRSLIVESNFSPPQAGPAFQAIRRSYPFAAIQYLCHTDGPVLLARFKQRAESGARHPGHVDRLNYAEFEPLLLQGRLQPVDLDCELVEVDTTDFDRLDYPALFEPVATALAGLAR